MSKKIFLILSLVVVLAMAFVACNNTPDEPDTTVEDTTVEDTTVEDTTVEDTTEEATEPATEETTDEVTEETTEPATEETTDEVTEETTEETTDEVTEEETAEEEVNEPVNVDLTTVGISGSYPTVDVPTNGPALGLTENDHVIALHYGSINLGELDLSQYSKITVTYATPTDEMAPGMADQYNATAKRVLLLNTASAVQEGTAFELLPADDAIITTASYEMSATNAAITTVEIDLTEIDYSGQVYLSFDFRNANNEFGATAYLIWIAGISLS